MPPIGGASHFVCGEKGTPGQAASRGRRVAVLVVSFWVWGSGDSLCRGRIRRAHAKIDGDCIPDGICPANKHLKIF
jgi:hypothetical protein